MYNGISSNPINWTNCAMFVEDPLSSSTNIAVEISKEELKNFQKMCSIFSSENLYDKCVDEYLSKVSLIQAANTKPSFPLRSLKTEIGNIDKRKKGSVGTGDISKTYISKKWGKILEINSVTRMIETESTRVLTRTQQRIEQESQIIGLLSFFYNIIDDSESVVPFGSAIYGFGDVNTCLDILIKAGEFLCAIDFSNTW